jgi:hypothetical protein
MHVVCILQDVNTTQGATGTHSCNMYVSLPISIDYVETYDAAIILM